MTDPNDLRSILATLRRQRVLIVVLTVLAAAVAGGVSLLQSTVYTTSTTVLYQPPDAIGTSNGATVDQARIIATLTAIPATAVVVDAVARQLHLDATRVTAAISVGADPSANLISIAYSAGTAEAARQGADIVASTFVTWRAKAERQLLQTQVQTLTDELATTPSEQQAAVRTQIAQAQAALANARGDLQVVQPALVPASPVSPKPIRNAVIGLFGGLVIAIAIAIIRARLDHRIATVEEAEAAYGLPLVGVVPFVDAAAKGDRSAGMADFSGQTALADAYRTIRTNLMLYRLDRGAPRVVLITSAVSGEGKSAAAANLAVALAVSGNRVLLLSADLRAPALGQYLPIDGSGSLLDALTATNGFADVTAPFHVPGSGSLDVIADSSVFSDPAALFGSERFSTLLSDAATRYDAVVLDAPPVIAAGDTVVLARHADAVLVVAALERTTHGSVTRTRSALLSAGIEPLGLIVTGGRNSTLSREGYGYGHGYGHES
jgi:capsular exopolysaccharide synthesis family protein